MRKITFYFILIASLVMNKLFAQEYHLIKKTVIGGQGGWDYLAVDEKARKLYVSHNTQVEVLNADTHEKIGVIGSLEGVHGIILIPKAGRGITTNGRNNTVTLFDLKTLKKISDLPTGKNPDAGLYDAFSKRVFVFNHSGTSATAIDPFDGKVIGEVELGGGGIEAGASDGKGTIFVNSEDTNEVIVFDSKSLKVKTRWKIGTGEEPTGIAIDTKTHRIFSVCHSGVMIVLNSDNGEVVTEVPIGKGVDGVIFDAQSKTIISSNGEGSLTVILEVNANEYKVLQTVKTERGARTIAFDPKTHHVFVSTAQYGETPAATTENPNPRPSVVADTFMVLEYGKELKH
jgi:DNA-binding beta-propeller fold protein YncE